MRTQYVEYFRTLEKALDQHKQKGTPSGDPVYQRVYEALAEDRGIEIHEAAARSFSYRY
jgi:hypothetical protein